MGTTFTGKCGAEVENLTILHYLPGDANSATTIDTYPTGTAVTVTVHSTDSNVTGIAMCDT